MDAAAERLPLLETVGRVLAEEVVADRDLPPFPRATRDGYAVRSRESKAGGRFHVAGEVRAGEAPAAASTTAPPNTCFEIMTGAAVPEGFDAVVMVEHTRCEGGLVILDRELSAMESIVPQGAEAKRGAALLRAGKRVGIADVALAASAGRGELNVWKKPRVAVLATGDELVEAGDKPKPHQIRNSNTYSLAAQVISAGGEPVMLPVAPDEKARLQQLMMKGFEADLLLIAGGVSMGKYDLVEQVLKAMGAEFLFTGVLIQPGRPAVFGRVSKKYFFGLPGNPVSTMVTFELFVRPFLRSLGGEAATETRFASAKLVSDFRTKTGLTRFLPARLSGDHRGPGVEVVRWQGSGDIVSASQAECFLVVPPDRDVLRAGEMVSILLR